MKIVIFRFRKNACQLLLKSDEDFVLVFKTWLKNSVRSQRPIIESPQTSRSLSSVYTVNTVSTGGLKLA